MVDLLIKGGRIVQPDRIIDGCIAVDDGKITRVCKIANAPKADKVINARNHYILAGVIDPHVHFRDPGSTHKEDFATGSAAAASGGVTTVLDMPNTRPPTTSAKRLNDKREIALKKSSIDFGLHFGSAGDNIEEIEKVENVASTKVFMNATTGGMAVTDGKLLNEIVDKSNMISAHAEDGMIRVAAQIATSKKKRLYVCHISSQDELSLFESVKDERMFSEVTPHHLFLDASDIKRLGSLAMMKPALKTKKDRLSLWKGLASGVIDTIGSDHAPHLLSEKEGENPPYGVPGVETTLTLMLNAVNRKLIRLEHLTRLTAYTPARAFNIKNKGLIKEGYDADFAIVDLKLEKTIRDDDIHTKCGWTPYNGLKTRGWAVKTILRGNVIFEDENLIKGRGAEVNFGAIL